MIVIMASSTFFLLIKKLEIDNALTSSCGQSGTMVK